MNLLGAFRQAELDDEQWARVKGLGLLSAKPVIYAANVADAELADGNEMVEKVRALAAAEGASTVVVSAQVEAELVELDGETLARSPPYLRHTSPRSRAARPSPATPPLRPPPPTPPLVRGALSSLLCGGWRIAPSPEGGGGGGT